ncbi:type II toxin-antitoxin system RelE/ParE family toxin [Candidatus Woesearchaeota archaeon]|jgi:mRNA interferase RelE/StbE|nr:type II toxin-antitoxin system RelE/ParE family toxin [Candidatus Woesearchaeota archaeon]MBT3537197.1 type II toxin-antitoxin system RelE/ParE family toxin [Candidatus Woesearchaeota archaeon]MBT4696657.1 type II toxin-antitoxin system RelE/ParE family toxin [Candidatus Woesearchaeota archaeon]MBT4716489.1 type II toxin-antitoxin system RelE/ParE family toxin [Candidatus Woesearchaeota archaeon]MBT7106493.1 type II toxin-antitoxin system RelE/ParE family toxin [Candidatus Woesearchaeota arc
MYDLVFDDKVIDFMNKLPKSIKSRIFTKLLLSKENPYRFFEKLSSKGYYKLRIGNYRAIADIDSRNRKIQVTLVGHRRNVYKRD